MAKQSARLVLHERKRSSKQPTEPEDMVTELRRPKLVTALEAKTNTQKHYINSIRTFSLVFGTGPAGTGKTFIAAALAAQALLGKQADQIIVTRPAVEAGEHLGFLPGDIGEKYDPYLAPVRDVLNERLGKSHVQALIRAGRIEGLPFAYMRGKTFRDAWVILDEAQNTTPAQMKLFLTRIGENCKVIVNGDETQSDINGKCGLTDAISRVSYIPSVKVVKFTKADVVRSGLCAEILQAYEETV
jgi:phosphate starvation-inducible protein PhoH and related proteins